MKLDKGKGKGKIYYNSGEKKFEGEFLDGKKWNGKIYDKDGTINAEYIKGHYKYKDDCIII